MFWGGGMSDFTLQVVESECATELSPAQSRIRITGATDLPMVAAQLGQALGLEGVTLTGAYDSSFEEWCVPNSLLDIPLDEAVVRVRISASTATQRDAQSILESPPAQPFSRRLVLLLARNEDLPCESPAPSLAIASRRLECQATDLPDLLSQISSKFGLPADIAIGLSATSGVADGGNAVTKATSLSDIPDKAKVQVWLPGQVKTGSTPTVGSSPTDAVQAAASVSLEQILSR